VLLLLLASATVWAAEAAAAPHEGRKVAAVIDEFREDGFPFAYSTNLVSADLVVQADDVVPDD